MDCVHHNYVTEENGYSVFCKKLHKVTHINFDACDKCPYLEGSLQGNGVECYWNDPDANGVFMTVNDPKKELMRVSKLIDEGKLKKG